MPTVQDKYSLFWPSSVRCLAVMNCFKLSVSRKQETRQETANKSYHQRDGPTQNTDKQMHTCCKQGHFHRMSANVQTHLFTLQPRSSKSCPQLPEFDVVVTSDIWIFWIMGNSLEVQRMYCSCLCYWKSLSNVSLS